MSAAQAGLLYDIPGPRARARIAILTWVFVAALVGAGVWVWRALAVNGQFEAAKWTPFLDHRLWATYLLPGLLGTLLSAAISIVVALLVGTALAVGMISDRRLVRTAATVAVEAFRSVPVLILMIFAYQLFSRYAVFPSTQVPLAAVVFGLSVYNGALIGEILRAGLAALPKGQSEAAVAVGLTKGQTVRLILLPQAVAAMLPALISQMVVVLKDAALGYQIGYIELIRSGQQAASFYRNFFASLVVVAVIMIAINMALTRLATWAERRLREKKRS
ncbi:amino acid ABC transporter permease [Segniliparus rugosus]|uniref:His/Glu/Gln/Arg/opine family amino ABC transporter, permease, 3-TM region n=1 Tax=Segniliparus rugosus (strain ATCC BAA-974 / DSM 45345 / CCUG 50838 / CIP 108380 / JCM 13579 / CDC 945) TaxID=679197 RepID=E5XMA8_SEGRC|nr:amino acid ABC transporter permease [Segniliparus rugosus]EFV14487.1 His/Glu/Gln/Arg/opine family amino ABC transporter, permease, 3-TM region [Segniliparus rugosus ATCC BAA-974]